MIKTNFHVRATVTFTLEFTLAIRGNFANHSQLPVFFSCSNIDSTHQQSHFLRAFLSLLFGSLAASGHIFI
jgi:hypothetical protein